MHNLYSSKMIFSRLKDDWTGGWLRTCVKLKSLGAEAFNSDTAKVCCCHTTNISGDATLSIYMFFLVSDGVRSMACCAKTEVYWIVSFFFFTLIKNCFYGFEFTSDYYNRGNRNLKLFLYKDQFTSLNFLSSRVFYHSFSFQ